MKLPLRTLFSLARRPSSFALFPLALAACSSVPTESVGTSSAAVVSASTSYLLPVEDDVRVACRSTWTSQFCDAGDARTTGAACVAAYVASGGAPACASDPAGCFQLYTASTPCLGDGPIYPTPESCLTPVERTCAFYSACLETDKTCGTSGYAIGYGEKYCSRYDVDQTFSPEGLVWRDATLHCLQEALVPELSKAPSMTCDAITDFAFDSHPRCYTENPSICFLPPSDVANVVSVIDGDDLLSLRSAKQIASVAVICVEQLAGTLLHFDAPIIRATLPADLIDRAAVNERLTYWRGIRDHGVAAATHE